MASHKNNFYFNFEGDNTNNHNLPVHPYTNFNSLETHSSPLSGSTYNDTDSLSEEKSKVIRKKRNTYQKIDDESRILLLELVKQGETLKAAARRYGINYSSAKSILHTFRKEGRILKKSAQERNARKRPTRTTSDLEMSPIYPYKQCQDINNDGSEDTSQQTYYSSELKLKSEPSSFSHITEEESPKFTILNPITINSFGDFLKIESQGHAKSDPLNTRYPPSTRIFKLEPQHLQRNSSMEVKGGNWQLNVNVHNQRPQRDPNPSDANNTTAIRVPGDLKSVDVFNYPNSSFPVAGEKIPRAEMNYEPVFPPKRYNTIADIMNHTDDVHAPEEPNYDISCFLNSSPAYAFQSKANEADQFVALDNFRGMNEPQECYYDGQTAYYENYGPGSNKENAGVVSSASLRTH